jgi:hypothetical protein
MKHFLPIQARLAIPVFIAGLVILAFWYVYRRGIDQNWDLLNYHYFSGYSLLHWRYTTDIAASGIQSFQSPISNILAYVSLSAVKFPLSSWIIAVFQLVSVPILVLIARQVGAGLGYKEVSWPEVTAILLCFLAPLWWSELGTTFADAIIGVLVLLGVYWCLKYISANEKRHRVVFLAGLFLGLATGVKLTGATFAIAAVISMFAIMFSEKQSGNYLGPTWLVVGIALGFMSCAWWNAYLWVNWGSPLFPFYNAVFESPFFDSYNWRDLRWRFGSFGEFVRFVYDAAFVTGKTAEIPFADARYLIISILVPISIFYRYVMTEKLTVVIAFFMTFVAISFSLWAVLFAYQRYLIPLELMFGLVIWILCRLILKKESLVLALLVGVFFISAIQLKVPDWGHRIPTEKQVNAFDLEVPPSVSNSPARYLVVGSPIGYILPFLHPDSQFFGLGVSKQIDKLIENKVSGQSALPLRILARESDGVDFWTVFSRFGLSPEQAGIACQHFRSALDWYIVCEVGATNVQLPGTPDNLANRVDLNFVGRDSVLPDIVVGVFGLSIREPFGRWSDSDEIVIVFGKCIPSKKVKVTVSGHAYGPNAGQPFGLFVGNGHAEIMFSEAGSTQEVYLDTGEGCFNKVRLAIPSKISPVQLGLGPDARQLGVKLSSLSFEFI